MTRAAIVASVILSFAAWLGLARLTMPYTSDSAAYIEAAERFGNGEGLVVTPYAVEPVDTDAEPLVIFPPGYPLLVWGATRLGLGAAEAALAVQGVCFAALPLLFFLLFRRLVIPTTAVVAAIACTWSSPVVVASLQAWSDVPFLASALASLALLFHGLTSGRLGTIAAAGLAAAWACLTRNVGYALVGAEVVGLGAAIVLVARIRLVWWRAVAAYGLGFVAIYGGWVGRNLLVLGTAQPYDLEPSELWLADNVGHLARTMATAFVGARLGGRAPALAPLSVVAAAALAAYGLRVLRARRGEPAVAERAVVWTTLAAYAVGGMTLLVVARTRYAWGEYINERHILQYQWILILALVASVGALGGAAARGRMVLRLCTAGAAAVFLTAQARAVERFLDHARTDARPELQQVRALAPAVAALPRDALVASNVAPLLRITSRRSVRQINAADTPPWLRDTVTPSRDLYLAVLPCRTFCRGLYGSRAHPAWLDDDTVPDGYEVVLRRDGSVLLHARGR